ncbi:Oligosaccharyltransferase complex subunit OSTC [Geodia barretti]|uniref:Oligosaccharyltransferase complex subunit n=1 Tax=Geodia barretti TaxID=519541 RepID=A0AA35TS60_GEOBA|nr:Oligosaccharyltransferase complex subunit OSTC [Geodia barretti]
MQAALEVFYRIPFAVLEVPNIRLKKPGFVKVPSAMVVFSFILFSYFLVTGGIIYDVIVEPPSIGSVNDEFGNPRPVAFMQYRVNGQYIMEGLASSFLFSLGGIGFIILDRSNAVGLTKLNRTMLFSFGFFCIIAAFLAVRVFMTMKLPGYLK